METEIRRDAYLQQLINRKENGLIKIITGIRRCGKSYLLRTIFKNYLVENGVKEDHIIEMAFDLYENIDYRDPKVFFPYVKEQIKDKNFKLVLIGKGSDEYTEHLKTAVSSKGIADKIVFAGFRHPVLPYVAGADFGILASTVREGCPLSPQEYMSQGHPVVVTDNGGQREYVEDGRNEKP